MCGVIGVLRRRSSRPEPEGPPLIAALDGATTAMRDGGVGGLVEASGALASVDRALRGAPGVVALVADPALAAALSERCAVLEADLAALEAALDDGTADLGDRAVEDVNAASVACEDAVWAVGRDRLGTAAAVVTLMGDACDRAAVEAYLSVQVALSALDRLEVRGRDSAGVHVLVTGHGIDASDPALTARVTDPLFTSGAVRVVDGALSFVYKAAAEIGELGDNGAALRAAITADALLRRAVSAPTAEATVIGHTRWASVGIISQPNAHPLNSDEVDGERRPYVTAALNGDVDNYVALREAAGLAIAGEVTTDAKIIPALVSRRMAAGAGADDAFRETVRTFEGSVAVLASVASTPDGLHLALRGSGQALYVGLAEDAYIVASEPYGLVEETASYLRMDGESGHGQIVVLDREGAGTLGGVSRLGYDGTPLPLERHEIRTAEITTRDIDRAGFRHFLLKEISEAPSSFRKTLRGKIAADDRTGRLSVHLGDETLPPLLRRRLATGSVKRIEVIGQGTAAVAGQSIAAALDM